MSSDRPLQADELAQFDSYRQQGFALLNLSPQLPPKHIVAAVDEYVDGLQSKRRGLMGMFKPKADATEISRALSVVWGDQIVRQFGWCWICHIQSNEDHFAVAAPNRSLVIYAPKFIYDCLQTPRMDCTVLLAFNMQQEGHFTGCAAGEYVDVMSGVRRIVPRR